MRDGTEKRRLCYSCVLTKAHDVLKSATCDSQRHPAKLRYGVLKG